MVTRRITNDNMSCQEEGEKEEEAHERRMPDCR